MFSYQLDQLGTPLSVTDSNNQIVWQANYSSFGKATVTVSDIDNPIRFQGQYFDEESGLHYNHFRYYDPTTGRFISQDPIGLLGGINHYQYAPNHINWVDPLGLSCKENAWNNFQKQFKGHFGSTSDAAVCYGRIKEVQVMEKGTRPEPSTYLPQSYIDLHLQQFSGGASRFMTKTNLDKYGPGQRDGTSFVMPSSEADLLMAQAAGDPSKLADSLGLPRKMLEGNDLMRVDFANPSVLGLRIPSGNEAGANDFWLVGGKLPDGSSEAIIDVGGVPTSGYISKNVTEGGS
ncbi:RHS repeat-associated core domain-containing protein [Alkalimonas sp.]|uniref:RHS repeat-associated core domain-containing protein n=1 Tax=Alkalimonas sp. TaxID=1872453 RepID=UPI00263A2423|nr:RHS repeat-associated core domain-containing protein [Alkalimonas sp.]